MTNQEFLDALGDSTVRLREFSMRLRAVPVVWEVDFRTDINFGTPSSVEWYVDAEVVPTDAVSWHLLVYPDQDAWVIEGDVRRITPAGQDRELELMSRRVPEAQLAAALQESSEELITLIPAGIHLP